MVAAGPSYAFAPFQVTTTAPLKPSPSAPSLTSMPAVPLLSMRTMFPVIAHSNSGRGLTAISRFIVMPQTPKWSSVSATKVNLSGRLRVCFSSQATQSAWVCAGHTWPSPGADVNTGAGSVLGDGIAQRLGAREAGIDFPDIDPDGQV